MPQHHPTQPESRWGPGLGLIAAGIGLLGFGCMMAVLMLAFARDLAALRDAPAVLWSALCGQPVQSDLTLPILFGASAASLAVGAVLLAAGRFRSRRQAA